MPGRKKKQEKRKQQAITQQVKQPEKPEKKKEKEESENEEEEVEDNSQEEKEKKEEKSKDEDDEEEEKEEEEKERKPLTDKEKRILNKLRKANKITQEEFEDRMGIALPKVPLKSLEQALEDEEKRSALEGYKAKKGEIDTTSKDIKVEEFTLSYQSQVLLKDTDLTIAHGRKYGLIGPNGSGKSTLLRHISNRHLPVPEHIQILHVEQEIQGSDKLAIDAVLEADEERINLLEEEEKLKKISEDNTDEGLAAHERLIEIYKRLRAIGAHSAPARAAAILSGLQFTHEMQSKATKEFSGGWRMRISLARALFLTPDLLLLDEPTNHLDLDATIWLEAYLKRYKKTILLVSHDRDFLNGIVTDVINLRHQKLEYYKGNYDSYEKGLSQAKKQHDKSYKKQQKRLEAAQEKQDKHSRDTKKKIEKQGIIKKAEKEYSVNFNFTDPGPLGYPVIEIKKAGFGYKPGDENLLFKDLELYIDQKSKIAIVGPNGSGKSTLMNMILGTLEPTKGQINRNRNLRVAKFSQHFMDQLTMTDTPVEYLSKKFPEMRQQNVRNTLGAFNLKGALHNQPIRLLSGGQKSRVAICEIALTKPHMFFLDEPTNHLDIQTVDALSEALQAFPGGIVLITHDQRLVSTVAKELWVCRGNQSVEIYDGDFDDYKQEIIDTLPDELFLSDDEK